MELKEQPVSNFQLTDCLTLIREGWAVMKLSRAVSYTYRKLFRKEEKL